MKKLTFLTLLIATITFISCDKENTDKPQTIDPSSLLVLNGVQPTRAVPTAPYPVDTVVRYAWELTFNKGGEDITNIAVRNMDLEKKKIIMNGSHWVVRYDKDSTIVLGFFFEDNIKNLTVCARYDDRAEGIAEWIDAYWIINFDEFTHGWKDRRDTIGYVPNYVIREVEKLVIEAFDKKDYAECVRLFEDGITFLPTTGEQWREMKDDGRLDDRDLYEASLPQ